MNRLTLRYGLMLGMGRRCPARKLARAALAAVLVAAAAWAAYLYNFVSRFDCVVEWEAA